MPQRVSGRTGKFPPTANPRDQRLLTAYLQTRWTVHTADGSVALHIGERVDPRVPVPSAIITAYNPGSVDGDPQRSTERNTAAQAELEQRLREMMIPTVDTLAHGTGTDAADWDEPGLLTIGIDRSDAVSIADAFGQNAIVWIGSDGVPVLVATRAGFAGASLDTSLPTRLSNDRP